MLQQEENMSVTSLPSSEKLVANFKWDRDTKNKMVFMEQGSAFIGSLYISKGAIPADRKDIKITVEF